MCIVWIAINVCLDNIKPTYKNGNEEQEKQKQ